MAAADKAGEPGQALHLCFKIDLILVSSRLPLKAQSILKVTEAGKTILDMW
ncbi:hypothetical protein ACP4OV_029367 [Aristida adscensionis]